MIRLVQICTTIIRNSLYNIVAMLELQICKIILIGDTGTFKTTFLTQLIGHRPQTKLMPTDRLCVFTTKLSTFPKIIQIWDTPGDPKYHYLTIGTAIKANLALLFVDVTNEHTALRAKTFLDQLTVSHSVQIHLVQTNTGQPQKRKVSKESLEKLILGQKNAGKIFTYSRFTNVMEIIEEILQNKPNYSLQNKTEKERIVKVETKGMASIDQQEENSSQPTCDCSIM